MENILQSIVKIIIIGSLYKSTNVDGNRQFPLPPPLPYYQNDGYFLPGFVPPYHEPLPVFYQEPNAPPPISYQNVNSYTPPQLFHQNENYHPPQFSNPGPRYPRPQYDRPEILHYKPNPPTFYNPAEQKKKFGVPEPVQNPQKEPAFYTTNIIIKDGPQQPFYQDDFNKNYQEDDYSENYSDDTSPVQEPCFSPYQYFEQPKKAQNSPNRQTLCNPHFQPNFGNGVYTVKMPITLLPSRFPPRVEEFIERIQNYFSTYNHPQTPKPENETSTPATPVTPVTPATPVTPVTTETPGTPGTPGTPAIPAVVQPVTEKVTSVAATVITITDPKKNTTTEIEELSLEETNSQPTEATNVATEASPAISGNEEVTQKTIVIEIEVEDTPNDQLGKKSQVVMGTPTGGAIVAGSTESVAKHTEVQMTDRTSPVVESTPQSVQGIIASSEKSTENLISNELPQTAGHERGTPATERQVVVADITTHPITEMSTKMEGVTTNEKFLEVTDKNG